MYHRVIDKRGTYICITLHDSCVSIHGCTRSVLFLFFFSFFFFFRIHFVHLDFPTVKHETSRISSVFRRLHPKVRIYFVRRKNQRIGIYFFLNRTRFCVAQDLFNKSDARVAYILYVFQDFESISFVERNKNDKETNIFKSQREEYIIRLRTKFFSQNIFQRVDRILSSLDIFLITLVKPTTNYPNRSITRFKISTYFDDIVHHLEYHSLLDMFLKIVEFGMTIRLRQVL